MAKKHLARVGFGIGRQVGGCADPRVFTDHRHRGGCAELPQVFKVFQGVIGHFFVKAQVGGQRGVGGQQQGVAICGRVLDRLGAQDAVGTSPVLDHHALFELRFQVLAKGACGDVARTTWSEGHHDLDRLVGKALSLDHAQAQSQGCQHTPFEKSDKLLHTQSPALVIVARF